MYYYLLIWGVAECFFFDSVIQLLKAINFSQNVSFALPFQF